MIDRVEIRVRSGDGGSGVVGFRRERFVPYGGPDGGDGGNGGDVVIRADATVDSLRNYRRNRLYRADKGVNGSGSRKHGRNGDNLVLVVPAGTVVTTDSEEGGDMILADLERAGEEVVVAVGGKGGWGNTHFTSSINQAPHIAQKGEPGEERNIRLEIRLIADVGIIGYPNAGKSTLLTAASAAKPKVADYPFTTLEPVLGVVEIGMETFVMAEIPGLIEGAHRGRGLGHEFLRHAMRTRVYVHVVDGSAESPVKDMLSVNEELASYDVSLASKPQIIAVNKIDLPEVQERMAGIKKELSGARVKAHYISAATGQGVSELIAETHRLLRTQTVVEDVKEKPVKVFRPQPRQPVVSVIKTDGEYVINAPDLERLFAGVGATDADIRWQLSHQLKRMGANKVLEKAGIKPGDRVRCGELTWEW
ncbi:MAG: GTPase ObgE [Dehalococcoidales bacterium]|nr:GTPase ObgE [Dehalococcoidales bacterium]